MDSKKMVKWIQLTDLHFFESTEQNMQKDSLEKIKDVTFLIITGDLKQYDDDYGMTIDFLSDIKREMCIEKGNLFFVPGNHDITEYSDRKKHINSISKYLWDNPDCYMDYRSSLTGAYAPFLNMSDIVCGKDFYKKEDMLFSLKIWDGRLNILHLNTSLICDKDSNKKQIVDTYGLSRLNPNGLPTIILMHHDFYSIHGRHQEILKRLMVKLDVRACLSGHTHQNSKRLIELPNGDVVHNIVSGKSLGQPNDHGSDTCMIVYEWFQDNVLVKPYKWSKNRFEPSFDFNIDDEVDNGKHGFLFRIGASPAVTHVISESRLTEPLESAETSRESVSPSRGYVKYAQKLLRQIKNEHALDNVFERTIPLDLCQRSLYPSNSNTEAAVTFNDIIGNLENQSQIILLAHSGAGKTVTLRQICESMADRLLYGGDVRLIVPVWINLRKYSRRLSDRDSYILITAKKVLSNMGIPFSHDNQILCYLLDGYNEVPYDERDHCTQDIFELAGDYVIITSRPYGYTFTRELTQYDIKPLTDPEIFEIAEYYLSNTDRVEMFKLQYDNLHASLKETLRKPLFLKLSLFTFNKNGRISPTISSMINDFLSLLYKWDKDRLDISVPIIIQEKAAGKIAFYMQELGGHLEVLKDDRLYEVINSCLSGTGYGPETVLRALCQHGILEDDDRSIVFYHQAFQEYFTARELYDRLADELSFERYLTMSKWRDIVLYMPGIHADLPGLVKQLVCSRKYDKSFKLAVNIAYQVDFDENVRRIIDDEISNLLHCSDQDDRDDFQREAVSALEEIRRYTELSAEEIAFVEDTVNTPMVRATKDRFEDILKSYQKAEGVAQ